MKRIFLSLGLLVSGFSFGQTIDTTIKSCTAAPIVNVVYSHNIPVVTDTITHLGVFNYTDDLKGNCTASWVLIATNRNILFNSYTLTSSEYTAWDGTPEGLLRIIANFLKVRFK
jgi:hypothetical protein